MAKQSNDTVPLILALLVTAGLVAGSLWYLRDRVPVLRQLTQSSPQSSSEQPSDLSPTASQLNLDTSLPNPNVLTIDGSVTMVTLIKQLQIAYTVVNPGLPTAFGVPDGRPNGTNAGIQNLIDGKVLLAASSRPLRAEEAQRGLQGVPIAKDALAITVGADNPFRGELTLEQLKGIFQGQITNWSEVGGPSLPIKVVNRSPDSGTYTFFQEVVLLGQPFAANSPNFTTAVQDETTPLLRSLGNNGITYSTVSQVENQKTVRIVPINGVSPVDKAAIQDGTYPIIRVVYLVVPKQTSPAVKQFIDLALSPAGQQAIRRTGLVPLQ